jgi:O-Antigen ligase
MALAQSMSGSGAESQLTTGNLPPTQTDLPRTRVARFLDPVIFGCLALFAILLPHSIKGAERAWKLALVLWLVKLVADRVRPFKQPLTAPLLAYVVLSAISTLLSPDPYLSWDRMKFVCLFLAGIVVAQNIRRLSQVRWLVVLLVFSGLSAALFTGWQYTYGIGVLIEDVPTANLLGKSGVRPNQIITAVAGQKVHSPEDLVRTLRKLPQNTPIQVDYIPYLENRPTTLTTTPEDFHHAGLGTAAMRLARGKPLRAQGTLGHYVVFAEMLMQIGCLAWALLLGCQRGQRFQKFGFALAFAGITAALFMTETRAAVAGLVIGCLITVLLLEKGKRRWAAAAGMVLILAGAVFWIQHNRGVQWVDRNDIGTHFRVLMWEDGVRLVRQHPWFGVGMETVRLHWREWNIRGFIQYHVQSHFHSTYLQIAVERGVPALLAWLWFCVAYIVLLFRLVVRLRNQSRFACAVAAGILAAFLAFNFTSFFHYNLGEEPLAMLLFFYYGIAVALDRIALPSAGVNRSGA